jgi:hypothetical protein
VPGSEWLDANEELNPDAEWRFLRLHAETAIALQTGLATGEFRSGRYVRGNDWDDNWTREEARSGGHLRSAPDGLPHAHPLPKTASGTTFPPVSHNHTCWPLLAHETAGCALASVSYR